MAFTAGGFARVLRRVSLIGLLAAVASCSKTTVAGVLLKFDTDGTLDPDTLHVTITANGQTPLDWCYPITNAATFFPTTLAIAPNGEPTETVAITASVLRAGVTLDVRQDYLTEVPNDRTLEYDILFSGKCSALVGPAHGTNCPYGVAASLCPPGKTCSSATGLCVGDADAATIVPDGDAHVSVPDAAMPPPQCAPGGPGFTNCGSSQDDNCCTSLVVGAGTYYRSYDLEPLGGGMDWAAPDGGATGLADPATLSTFRLDKYDVTVGRFRRFVSTWDGGAGWTPPAGSGKHTHLNGGKGLLNVGAPGNGVEPVYETGWIASESSSIAPTNANLACDPYATWTAEVGSNESRPINCVSWLEAYAFCIWDGGFLPSEAEWQYAAAGGNQQRPYPWGSADPGTENQYAIYGCYYPFGPPGFMCSSVSNIAPVGTVPAGAGLFGHLDLAGEVYQWTLDWYANFGPGDDDGGIGEYLPGAPCFDCAVLTGSYGRVIRGGNWAEDEATLLTANRDFFFSTPPDTGRDLRIGVRCARSP
jgi:formylglycine-generating enzyme